MAYDYLARWSYERLILEHPEHVFSGLWEQSGHYYAVCPGLSNDMKARDGKSLSDWFSHSGKALGAPIHLIAESPPGAQRTSSRSLRDLIEMKGAPRTVRDVSTDLLFSLPRTFPDFIVECPTHQSAVITVRQQLDPEELVVLNRAWQSLGLSMQLDVKVAPSFAAETFRHGGSQGDLLLVPGRRLRDATPRALRIAVEDDDDFWATHRTKVLGDTASIHSDDILHLRRKEAACLVNASVFPPSNIRSFLTLYRRVNLVLPLGDRFHEQCSALGSSPQELVELMVAGRVHVLCPQSVDRYSQHWLGAALEAAPQSVTLSRRLALATVLDTRRRWPMFYPPFGIDERRICLEVLHRFHRQLPESTLKARVGAFCTTLIYSWQASEGQLNDRGAMGSAPCGIPGLAANIVSALTGKDHTLEVWSAGASVEWASALGACVVPASAAGGYSEQGATDYVASLYSPERLTRVPTLDPEVFAVLDGILAVDNDVPLLPFATELAGPDIDRLREVVLRVAAWNVDLDYQREAIAKFNAEVRRYERRYDRLRSLNIVGFGASVGMATATAMDPTLGSTLGPLASLGPALAAGLFLLAKEELAARSGAFASALDFTNGLLAGVRPEAVLVSRLRREIKLVDP